MDNPLLSLLRAEDETDGKLRLATVYSVQAGGLQLVLDGETEPTRKLNKKLASYSTPVAGDRVVIMKHSGTHVVLGALGASQDPAGIPEVDTTTISEIAAAASGWEITYARYSQWGRLAMVMINMTATEQVTVTSSDPIATIVAGKRPAIHSSAQVWLSTGRVAAITSAGGLLVNGGTISAETSYTFLASYLLP